MKTIRLALTLMLALPFAAFSAALEPSSAIGTAPQTPVVEDAGSSYECCYIFWMGSWYCVPC